MKTQVWVYIVVVLLSVGAGVAIAGLPELRSRGPDDPTARPPERPFEPATEPADTEPADAEPAATEPDVIEPAASHPPPPNRPTRPRRPRDDHHDHHRRHDHDEPATTTTTVPLPERSEVSPMLRTAQTSVAPRPGCRGARRPRLSRRRLVRRGRDRRRHGDLRRGRFQGPAERLADEVGLEPSLVLPIAARPRCRVSARPRNCFSTSAAMWSRCRSTPDLSPNFSAADPCPARLH